VDDNGIHQLVKFCKSTLVELNVSSTHITEASLMSILAHCHVLKHLNLSACVKVHERAILNMLQGGIGERLHTLDVSGLRVTVTLLEFLLLHCPLLVHLTVDYRLISSNWTTSYQLLQQIHLRMLIITNVPDTSLSMDTEWWSLYDKLGCKVDPIITGYS
jgi:hypothetical protein